VLVFVWLDIANEHFILVVTFPHTFLKAVLYLLRVLRLLYVYVNPKFFTNKLRFQSIVLSCH